MIIFKEYCGDHKLIDITHILEETIKKIKEQDLDVREFEIKCMEE